MTIKTLLFALFLYVCLVWVGAALLRPNDIQHFGLLWTAIGLIIALVFILGARLFGWWRSWRAKVAARPAAPASPTVAVHEDDAALAALIAEANAELAKSPAYAAKGGMTPLSAMPLYLLIGADGSGKTSTYVNSGLEPQLLAGQVAGTAPIIPTRLCNIWLAKEAIFVELSGRVFGGDLARWTQLLKVLRGRETVPLWRRLWREQAPALKLHGVVGFCDVKEFTGRSSPEFLGRRSRDWQERLRAIGEVFGVGFPVYQLITRCDVYQPDTKNDALPFFRDFFRRLPEPEANQVLGCTLALRETAPSPPVEAAEDRVKVLTRSFRVLYHELARRRLTHLAYEPDLARRPGIYEFPRELKRIRTPLIQFLSDTIRPHPLQPGPLLRGYYFTGVREVEQAAGVEAETRPGWSLQKVDMDASRLFSPADASRLFRPDELSRMAKGGAGLVNQWIFTADLFKNVVLADRTARHAVPVDSRVELYRKSILAAASGLCLLLCFSFMWSWTRNRALLYDIGRAADADIAQPGKPTLAALPRLNALREQLQRLIDWEQSKPWGLSWGLYSGDRVVDKARQAYFRRFQDLLLNSINGDLVVRLRAVSATPAEDAPYDPIYRLLQTHLMISGSCGPPDSTVVAQVLTSTRKNIKLASGSPTEEELADRQILFYAGELPHESLWRLTVDPDARTRAQAYLQNIKGIDRTYKQILSRAESTLAKPKSLAELAPKYADVLKGPDEPSGAFARDNWDSMQALFKKSNDAASGDCVVGGASDAGGSGKPDADVTRQLQSKFVADYIAHWRDFVKGFSVRPYGGPEDAARKLQILASYQSPLLALFFLTGTQTNFPTATDQRGTLEKLGEKVGLGEALSGKKKVEQAAQNAGLVQPVAKEMNSSDITRVFQPVREVVTPASDKWVGGKNSAYIQALADLGQSMKAIAASRTDVAVQQAAQVNYDKAIAAAKQIENGFLPMGVDGLNLTVQTLLEQPILHTNTHIITDMGKAAAAQINGQLRRMCDDLRGTLRKYPFQPSSKDDVSLEELTKAFGPGGTIWQFQQKSLADLTQKDGSQWKPNASAKLQVTQGLLSFLTHAQAIADVFFAGGTTQPQLTYSIRPKPDDSLKDWTLTLAIDGKKHEWTPTSSLQTPFRWPAPAVNDQGAVGRRAVGGSSTPFASEGGLWGIFRILDDAEPRPPLQKAVEWKFLRSGDGRKEAIQPPVRLEIVEFPGGKDVFNPAFFSLQCPQKAVE